MSPWTDKGFIPERRSNFHCHDCGRVFAKRWVPQPDQQGRRICRDCNLKHFGAYNMPKTRQNGDSGQQAKLMD